MKGERIVAGLACSDVLERLSSYVDDELATEERERLEAHVRGCDHCARFGGAFAEVVKALRERLAHDDPPPGLRGRILDQL